MKPHLILIVFTAAVSSASAHDHFAAGIVDSNNNYFPDAGEPLSFVGASGTDRIFHLLPRPVGFRPAQRCGGYYMLDERPRTLFPTDSFSIIALSDGQYDAASPNHAHTGALIVAEITSVSGPAGANFGFWDQDHSYYFDTPSVSFPTNQATGNHRFLISEGIDDVNDDPAGHIHGRSWTADRPGGYEIGIRLVDISTTDPGGGPWHQPSQIYIYHFEAGPAFQPTIQPSQGNGCVLTWPSLMGTYGPSQTGIVFNIQRSTSVAADDWTTIGTVTGTSAGTASFRDPSPPATKAFYRLRYDWSAR
ncbi:MAG: hypothetical protein ABI600_04255 [Luteolibacter sp.]